MDWIQQWQSKLNKQNGVAPLVRTGGSRHTGLAALPYRNIQEATKGKLLIFVTHRLSFARQADQILYLKNGMIAEHGTHEELMEKGGDYCRMFTTQRRQYFAQEGENDAV